MLLNGKVKGCIFTGVVMSSNCSQNMTVLKCHDKNITMLCLRVLNISEEFYSLFEQE